MDYTYYILRVDFDNGEWGYVAKNSSGYYLTKDTRIVMVWDSKTEAETYYVRNLDYYNWGNGARVVKACVSTLRSSFPM